MERLAILFMPVLLLVGLAQVILGYLGLEYFIGFWPGLIVGALCLTFGFMLPLTVASYFGAVEVLGWPWWVGVLVVFPGLVFMVPAVVSSVFDRIRLR